MCARIGRRKMQRGLQGALQGVLDLNIRVACDVTNTGSRDGDEVVLVFHSAGPRIRAKATHPVPAKALVGFERVRVPAGETRRVAFALDSSALELVDASGGRRLYPGTHTLQFSRGVGPAVDIEVEV